MGPKVVPMGPKVVPMMPKVMPMGPKGPILGNPWKVILQGRADVDFLIDVSSGMLGQELNGGCPDAPDAPTTARDLPSTRAGGQDDVSSKQTPSNNLFLHFILCIYFHSFS